MTCIMKVVLVEDFEGCKAGEIFETTRWRALKELIPSGIARKVQVADLKRDGRKIRREDMDET